MRLIPIFTRSMAFALLSLPLCVFVASSGEVLAQSSDTLAMRRASLRRTHPPAIHRFQFVEIQPVPAHAAAQLGTASNVAPDTLGASGPGPLARIVISGSIELIHTDSEVHWDVRIREANVESPNSPPVSMLHRVPTIRRVWKLADGSVFRSEASGPRDGMSTRLVRESPEYITRDQLLVSTMSDTLRQRFGLKREQVDLEAIDEFERSYPPCPEEGIAIKKFEVLRDRASSTRQITSLFTKGSSALTRYSRVTIDEATEMPMEVLAGTVDQQTSSTTFVQRRQTEWQTINDLPVAVGIRSVQGDEAIRLWESMGFIDPSFVEVTSGIFLTLRETSELEPGRIAVAIPPIEGFDSLQDNTTQPPTLEVSPLLGMPSD